MSGFQWVPYGRYLERSRVRQFMDLHKIGTWQELIRRSTQDLDWFWHSALDHLGIEWFQKFQQLYDDSQGMPWTRWFVGGKLNIVHNCLDRHVLSGRGANAAVWFESDDGSQRSLTYQELYDRVNRLASALKRLGVEKGQRIAMCMPICPEAVAIMFAAFKIGAACVQLPARLPADEIVARIQRAGTPVLFLNDGYPRAGKLATCDHIYKAVVKSAPCVQHIVVNERIGKGLAQRPQCISWNDLMAQPGLEGGTSTESLDSEHPALILYSSGTTGKAKTVIHTHGGVLSQLAKELGYAFDCHSDDVLYWFTNIGWMMAPWEIIGTTFFGASVVLFEGTHLHPTPHRLFELIERYKISIFGCTPAVLRELAKLNLDFARHDLSTVRILGSTGSILDAPTWEWYFKVFGGGRCPIMNVSGGTEMMSCMLSPLPVMPLKPATLGGPGLAIDADAVDSHGNSVRGQAGYLVCRKPFPSMTRGFLGDPDLFMQTYFPNGPDCWVHGDLVKVDEDGYWFILGRSDDLIVRSGVKHDPAKIEEGLLAFPGPPKVREAAAIGVDDPLSGERIVCFVVLGAEMTGSAEDFRKNVSSYIKQTYDPMAQPDEIHIVSELPLNLSSKIPRRLIRTVYEGKPAGNIVALGNPHALEEIRRAAENAQASRKHT